MHYYSDKVDLLPAWSQGAEQRLLLAMLPGALIVALLIMSLRLPMIPDWKPVTEFVLDVILAAPEEVQEAVQSEQESMVPVPESPSHNSEAPARRDPAEQEIVAPRAAPTPAPPTDWNALAAAAVTSYVDAETQADSVNPPFDEKRRVAASRYRPSRAPVKNLSGKT